MTKRLAIITSHPIQYNAPLFALLALRGILTIKVFYTWGEGSMKHKFDPGFNKNIEWDIPLLENYDYTFVNNISKNPGSHHFKGIDNPTLVQEITQWEADAVLVYGWAFKSHLKTLRYFHKKLPVFFRGDSTLLIRQNPVKSFMRTHFLRWVYSHVDKALFVGTHNKEYFLKHGIKENQLVFVPHAVDNLRYQTNIENSLSAAAEWRIKLNIGHGDLVFLSAAKLDQNKNVQLLIDAFESVKQNDTHLIIAGNGELEKPLHDKYSGSKNIHFIPFQNQSNMPVVYRLGDVFVISSKSETWGLSINEAMACGRALLVSDSCGAAIDLVQNEVNGYTFKSNNQHDLQDFMQRFIDDHSIAEKFGEASLNVIKKWNYIDDCKAIEALMLLQGNHHD